MGKNYLVKFIAAIVAFLFIALTILTSLALFEIVKVPGEEKEMLIKNSMDSVSQFISVSLKISDQDLDTFLKSHANEIIKMLQTESRNSDSFIFITDESGSIILTGNSGDDIPQKMNTIPAEFLGSAKMYAQSGEIFVSDFGGLFSEEKIACGSAMQKTLYSANTTRTVAMVFAVADTADGFFSAGTGPIIIVLFIFLIVAFIFLCFTVHTRVNVPIKDLKNASKRLALGDYTVRMSEKKSGELRNVANDFNSVAEKIEISEKNTDSFLSDVSHDLRTPMTAIDGYVQMMQEGIIPEEKYPHYLGIIHDEMTRLSRRVTSLLEMSRMKAGSKKYNFEKCDLCEMARQSVIAFESRITEKNIDISFLTEKDRTFVSADKDSIQQVIYNLIDNAIKFTPENGRISFDIRTSSEKAFFAIENTGEGIPPEELPRVFDRFFKSDRSRELDKKGTGLGLFIAKSVIEAHGEEIWVTSEYGKYCKFVFSLPLSNS